MIDRSQAPNIQSVSEIQFVEPERRELAPNLEMIAMTSVPNETARFDLYFDAGKCRGDKSVASLVNGLLLSGTESKTSVEIQESINSLGGFHESGMSTESAVFSIYCLREHLETLFNIVTDAIENVAFDPSEVEELLSDRTQKLQINQGKVNFLSQQAFREVLFASNPRYARPVELSDYENVSIDELRNFHQRFYKNGLTRVVVVGDIQQSALDRIAMRSLDLAAKEQPSFETTITNTSGRVTVEKKDALQSAVRLGRILFNKTHPDYLDFLVLNTVLGDYFGSRLMTNIREDKGYTYGIGSALVELDQTGYFTIGTEVGSGVREDALEEIQFEIERIRTELVPDDELERVRNYMMGQLLKSADGPYAMTDLYLSAHIHGQSLDFYNDAIRSIQTITPERIRELAQRHLDWNDFSVVTAG